MVQQKQYHRPNHNWNLDYFIILDYGSTIKVTFINTDLVNNIKPINNILHMSNNEVTKKMNLQGDIKNLDMSGMTGLK